MNKLDIIKQIDWNKPKNKEVGKTLLEDALEYLRRVEDHIYKSNEIRDNRFMDRSEKQEEIDELDKKRTIAHNKTLESFKPFLDLLKTETEFNADDYALENRAQIADFLADIAFEAVGKEPSSRIEGGVRDDLAEKVHKREITYEQIKDEITNHVCNS